MSAYLEVAGADRVEIATESPGGLDATRVYIFVRNGNKRYALRCDDASWNEVPPGSEAPRAFDLPGSAGLRFQEALIDGPKTVRQAVRWCSP